MIDEDIKAGDLQFKTKHSEQQKLEDGLGIYDEEEVNQAIVHTRQDGVLLVSYISSITKILKNTRNILLWVVIILLIFLVLYLIELRI